LSIVATHRKENYMPQRPPGFFVLQQVSDGSWRMLGEVPRRRGLPARAARTRAIMDATDGAAKAGDVYAAVLSSEWRIAQDWSPE
jgi:hypothetical protein